MSENIWKCHSLQSNGRGGFTWTFLQGWDCTSQSSSLIIDTEESWNYTVGKYYVMSLTAYSEGA